MGRALEGRTPSLPARWFWDEEGARIHRMRTGLASHYPARIERELYASHAPMLVGLFEPQEVADLAPATSRHVRALVSAMLVHVSGARCALLDAEPLRLGAAVRRLAADYPRLDVRGAVGDCFGASWRLGRGGGRLLLLTGSGPDGLDPTTLTGLLRRLARRLEPDDALVLGVDLGADPAGLVGVCQDEEGLAAAFHRNGLRVINARLGADFDPGAFAYEAAWDAARGWVETRLRPRRAFDVAVPGAGVVVAFDPSRPLVTGRVGTWTRAALRERAAGAGLALKAWLTDPEERRALVVLQPQGRGVVTASDFDI
ncbi:MAG: L-histidine N(alpha)-methyltransferase [Pseudomonadota bacterium]|nr:L-histidine N(alpha)-methyltransferase [Pseudomonadota bacterium]